MNIIFLGTPEFSANILRELIKSHHKVVAVVSQPDKPTGRKQILEPTPTKKVAIENGIKVFQFEKIRKTGVEPLKELNADVMVTVAYGQILSKEVLEITKYGTINVHGSILPKYRGSSPFQWVLIKGEKKTGITIMKTDVGIDSGDIYSQKEFEIKDSDKLEDLYRKAEEIAPKMLIDCLDSMERGEAVFVPQNHEEMTYYPMLKPELSYVDFDMSGRDFVNLVRGIAQWPTVCCLLNGMRLNIYSASIKNLERDLNSFENGEIVECDGKRGITIKLNDAFVSLDEVQLQGGKQMNGKSFANGNRAKVGDKLIKISLDGEV